MTPSPSQPQPQQQQQQQPQQQPQPQPQQQQHSQPMTFDTLPESVFLSSMRGSNTNNKRKLPGTSRQQFARPRVAAASEECSGVVVAAAVSRQPSSICEAYEHICRLLGWPMCSTAQVVPLRDELVTNHQNANGRHTINRRLCSVLFTSIRGRGSESFKEVCRAIGDGQYTYTPSAGTYQNEMSDDELCRCFPNFRETILVRLLRECDKHGDNLHYSQIKKKVRERFGPIPYSDIRETSDSAPAVVVVAPALPRNDNDCDVALLSGKPIDNDGHMQVQVQLTPAGSMNPDSEQVIASGFAPVPEHALSGTTPYLSSLSSREGSPFLMSGVGLPLSSHGGFGRESSFGLGDSFSYMYGFGQRPLGQRLLQDDDAQPMQPQQQPEPEPQPEPQPQAQQQPEPQPQAQQQPEQLEPQAQPQAEHQPEQPQQLQLPLHIMAPSREREHVDCVSVYSLAASLRTPSIQQLVSLSNHVPHTRMATKLIFMHEFFVSITPPEVRAAYICENTCLHVAMRSHVPSTLQQQMCAVASSLSSDSVYSLPCPCCGDSSLKMHDWPAHINVCEARYDKDDDINYTTLVDALWAKLLHA